MKKDFEKRKKRGLKEKRRKVLGNKKKKGLK